jgi:transcriptional regulator GlxA family with amidase domain
VASVSEDTAEAPGHALSWREINRVFFVAAAAGAIWFSAGVSNPYITAVGVICTLVGGFPIFREAYENIVERRMRSRRVAAICTGTFVLAAAGLLNGKRAVTHWAYCDKLSRVCPPTGLN